MAIVLQVVGFKNSGKTTLIRDFIGMLKQQSYTVHAIKHDAHDFEMDHIGTDTYFFAEEGADAVMITSSEKYAIVSQENVTLHDAIAKLGAADITLVEGYKNAPFPKIVLLRSADEMMWFKQEVGQIIAFVSLVRLEQNEVTFIGTNETRTAFLESLIGEFLE
ncbi:MULTISPECIES: molybdopterin-guanine dinucleotide biosynthesis protein B [Listeria]|uniref:molybdopterin-guanine dinucleotide biosynthesis protein B n=1 Tax=Listeria TaxID=1637 RepID=UPI000B58AD79|nr:MULTISPECIES: molybdopterin-guanine dinucleotide biosynthesis protein B [Listeria]